MTYNIGMIGLAVMGENLVLNIESKGFTVCGFDIDSNRMDQFSKGRAQGKQIGFATSLEDLVQKLETPRKIMMMIRAGSPVDQVIQSLLPLLDKGDVIIDGGNSHYPDTIRRHKLVEEHGFLYVGAGVSGGEEGALLGPSIMPGGSEQAWPLIQPIFQAIAAKTDTGEVCCEWVGSTGSGHYVKMIHNGIEYGDIQLIAEVYHIMREVLQMSPDEMSDVFEEWNKGELQSYLIEITVDILRKKDEDGTPLIDKILDTAGQKGTGKWTAVSSLDEGVPLSLITEAVYARTLSAQKNQRMTASAVYQRTIKQYTGDKQEFLEQLKDTLYVAKIISYAQGFVLLQEASKTYNWNLNYGNIALLWRGGCIIRSAFLGKINDGFKHNPALSNLLLDPFFKTELDQRIEPYREVLAICILCGLPTPSLSAGLNYFDGYTTENLPANLLQAMRDYFGAHTYERTDKPRGEFFHTNWTGKGGNTSSTTYNV